MLILVGQSKALRSNLYVIVSVKHSSLVLRCEIGTEIFYIREGSGLFLIWNNFPKSQDVRDQCCTDTRDFGHTKTLILTQYGILVLPGIDQASRITANMIQVLWRYQHNLVLMVFCLAGIVTLPILVIFTKPLMLTANMSCVFDLSIKRPCK